MSRMPRANQTLRIYRVLAMLKTLRRSGACRIAHLNPGGYSERQIQRDMLVLIGAGFAERVGKGLYKYRAGQFGQ